MKTLIGSLALASILATAAVAAPVTRNASTEYGSPNARYVPPALSRHSTRALPFTWGEKHSFDWANKDNYKNSGQ